MASFFYQSLLNFGQKGVLGFMHWVRSGIFFIIAFCTAVLSYAEPGYCFFNSRECEDWQDSVHAERLPDSLRVTLQQKIESDTGLIFWGNAYAEYLANVAYHNKIDFWSTEKISREQKSECFLWHDKQHDLSLRKLDSIPSDLKDAYIKANNTTLYGLLKVKYQIDKVYDRKTRSWNDPEKGYDTLTRFHLIHQGPIIETNPPKLLAEISLEGEVSKLKRIYFEDGHSRIIENSEFKSLESIAKQQGSYLPNHYILETHKNMSPIYKTQIMEALVKGDKDAIRENTAKLDTFLVHADKLFFYSSPSNLNCNTKRLLSAYLGTFEDYADCPYYPSPYVDDEEATIHAMLQDSLRAMYRSGELENALLDRSSSDRAFWRILAAALVSDNQSDLNDLIKANEDSVKKIEQWNFITTNFYVDYGVGWNIQMGMGGGISLGFGDAFSYDFDNHPTFDITLEFFYKKLGGGYNMRNLHSKTFDDNKFQSLVLIDLYAGYRTFVTSYVENRIYLGPTILISDLQEKDVAEPLKTHGGVGLHCGTAFDFYFSKYKDDGQLRLGLRLFASVSNYYTDIVKDSDGGIFSVTLTPLLQFYDRSKKKYGEAH